MKTGRPNLEFGAARRSFPWVGGMIIHFICVYCKRFLVGVLRSSKMPQLASSARQPVVRAKTIPGSGDHFHPGPVVPSGRRTAVLFVT